MITDRSKNGTANFGTGMNFHPETKQSNRGEKLDSATRTVSSIRLQNAGIRKEIMPSSLSLSNSVNLTQSQTQKDS